MAIRSFCLSHPNKKNTGSQLVLSAVPACGCSDGCIHMIINPQSTVSTCDDGITIPAMFSRESGIHFDLEFAELCEILMCLNAGIGMKKIIRRDGESVTTVHFAHVLEPKPGYLIKMTETVPKKISKVSFIISPSESIGIERAISGVMPFICFGVPSAV